MRRLSVFHSRLGAAALAAALYYSFGAPGQAELLFNLRRLLAEGLKPRAFISSDEAVLAIADRRRPAVLQRAISNVVGCLRPQVEICFYSLEEREGLLLWPGVWLLGRGLLPNRLAMALAQYIWDGVKK
ncbi:MAG: hypothetical protein GX033_03065 [Firmicutes bacterium]|nr:hypothetical protein [Bacillota bacterium]